MSDVADDAGRTREAVARWSPAGAEGFERIRAAATRDGALAGAEKALITAAAAAAAGRASLVGPAVARAIAGGLPREHAWAVAPILLLARGDEACTLFTAALLAHAGEPAAGPAATPFVHEDGLAYFRDYFGGEIPPRIRLLAERAPEAFAGYAQLHRSALRESVLPAKLAELVLCAANAATFQTVFVEIHAEAARSVGATEEDLVEAIVAAIPVSGVAAWASAAGVVR